MNPAGASSIGSWKLFDEEIAPEYLEEVVHTMIVRSGKRRGRWTVPLNAGYPRGGANMY